MEKSRSIMGMPISIKVVDKNVSSKHIEDIFSYFQKIDKKFSTYKKESEVSKIDRGEIDKKDYSSEMRGVLSIAEKTKKETNGYFDVYNNGKFDPSGIVKGWAIKNASDLLLKRGYKNFYINCGGDVQVFGTNSGKPWEIGIRNPFDTGQIVKVLKIPSGMGLATSGNYERGEHIYNPKGKRQKSIISISVIGSDVLEADRFATAVFAMGTEGINFLEKTKGLEGYMIDKDGIGTQSSGFDKFIASNDGFAK